jgi:pilus assembly protein CpaE
MSPQRIVLAIADPALAAEVGVLGEESGTLDVVATVVDAHELTAVLGRTEIDAVLVHEDLGPLPVLELTRRLAAEHPTVGFLLLAREATPDLLRQALRAGVRDVLSLPLTVEAVSEAVEAAAGWSRAVRDRMEAEDMRLVAERVGGRVIAVAGAKGGVGTSTVALHLASAVARADAERTVCLVELDLQIGDLRALLDVQSRRSIADLVAVAAEITQRSLDDTLYVHPSGLRVLLAPDRGEDAEDVGGAAARGILAALKFQYDVVVCDIGAVMTEAGAVAVEMASDVLVVSTPDVPALRAANRLLDLWDRLRIRSGDAQVLLNRVSRESEIQPEFARKVVAAEMLETTIPAAFRDLESALNTGAPDRLEQGGVYKALTRLAQEIGAVAPTPRSRRLRLRAAARAQAGQSMVETLALITFVAIVLMGLWEIVLIGYTDTLASHSAREAARAWAVGEPCLDPARKPLPKAWQKGMKAVELSDGVKVTLRVPFVFPGLKSPVAMSDRKRTLRENGATNSISDDLGDQKGTPCKAS